eukprot:UN23581
MYDLTPLRTLSPFTSDDQLHSLGFCGDYAEEGISAAIQSGDICLDGIDERFGLNLNVVCGHFAEIKVGMYQPPCDLNVTLHTPHGCPTSPVTTTSPIYSGFNGTFIGSVEPSNKGGEEHHAQLRGDCTKAEFFMQNPDGGWSTWSLNFSTCTKRTLFGVGKVDFGP